MLENVLKANIMQKKCGAIEKISKSKCFFQDFQQPLYLYA